MSRTRWVILLTGLGSLMAALDTLVVATALNTIRHDLHASLEQLEWTANAYNLSLAVLLLPAAALGDRFGRRRLYAIGLAVFSAASGACALAPDAGFLIGARAIQGVGAALVLPLGLTLLSAAFTAHQRGAAIGIFSAITGLSVASGPLIGGAVVDGLSWQWIFWINVPLGLVAVPLAVRKLQEGFGPDSALDLAGLSLSGVSALGLVWALVRGNSAGWSSSEVLVALVIGVGALVTFFWWERRAPAPMIPLALFRSRSFSAGNAAIFCTFAALFSTVFFYSQYLQTALGYSPLGAGLRLTVWTITFLTVAPLAGAYAGRLGERRLMVVGLLLDAAGMAWLAVIAGSHTSFGALVGPFLLGGVGVSMTIPCAQNAVVGELGTDDIGKAAGANSMMRELGGVFGIAVAAAVFARSGGYGSPSEFIAGFRPAVWASVGFALAGAVAAAMLPGRRRASPQQSIQLQQAESVVGMHA